MEDSTPLFEAVESNAAAAISETKISSVSPPSTKSSKSISEPLPRTTPERLAEASDDSLALPESGTVIYLAYGSNLSAETFRGRRGIRPLSRVSVSVPTLELTFSLPGIPYKEPCFANVDYRKMPRNPKLPDNPIEHPPKIPHLDPPHIDGKGWDGGLIGVAYEVTVEDYRTIIRTEGGGASYQQIAVPCIPLPPKMSVPEKPPIPELPRPFFARTLYAPYIPIDKIPTKPGKDRWWHKLLLGPHRPTPDYAQPSARYLKLLTDGARENELPDEYQEWMASLQPYTVTTWWQVFGQIVLFGTLAPLFLTFMAVSKPFVGKDGKLPKGLAMFTTVLFAGVWWAYDLFLKDIFGDGEHTEEPQRKRTMIHRSELSADEEKASMLQRDW